MITVRDILNLCESNNSYINLTLFEEDIEKISVKLIDIYHYDDDDEDNKIYWIYGRCSDLLKRLPDYFLNKEVETICSRNCKDPYLDINYKSDNDIDEEGSTTIERHLPEVSESSRVEYEEDTIAARELKLMDIIPYLKNTTIFYDKDMTPIGVYSMEDDLCNETVFRDNIVELYKLLRCKILFIESTSVSKTMDFVCSSHRIIGKCTVVVINVKVREVFEAGGIPPHYYYIEKEG